MPSILARITEPMYDDMWLRELLREMNDKIEAHAERDELQHADLRVRLEEMHRDLHVLHAIGHAAKWIVALMVGAGGLGWLFKNALSWSGKS